MRDKLFVAAIVSLGAMAQSAQAQDIPQVDRKAATRIDVHAGATYESNIARSSRAAALMRGIDPQDVTYYPSLNLDTVKLLGRQALFLRGVAGYEFHQHNTQLNDARADVTAGIAIVTPLCRPMLFGTYQGSQTDLAMQTGPIVKNFNQTVLGAVSLECGSKRGLNGNLLYEREKTTNSAVTQRVANHTTETGAASLAYAFGPRTGVNLTGSYSKVKYPNRKTGPEAALGDGYQLASVGLGIQQSVGRKLNATALVSYTRIERNSAPPGVPLNSTGETYRGKIEYKVSPRLNFTLEGARAITPSSQPGILLDITTRGELRGLYRLGTRFEIEGGASVEELHSDILATLPVAIIKDSQTRSGYLSARYKFNKKASFLLELRREERTTNLPTFDYQDTSVGLSAELQF